MGAKNCAASEACTAANRFIVQAGIHDAFVAGLSARMAPLTVGPGRAAETQRGQMITAQAVEKIDRPARRGRPRRAGDDEARAGGEGFFYPPTVIEAVVPVRRFSSRCGGRSVETETETETRAEAVALTNDTEYGFAAYVYSGDLARALKGAAGSRRGWWGSIAA